MDIYDLFSLTPSLVTVTLTTNATPHDSTTVKIKKGQCGHILFNSFRTGNDTVNPATPFLVVVESVDNPNLPFEAQYHTPSIKNTGVRVTLPGPALDSAKTDFTYRVYVRVQEGVDFDTFIQRLHDVVDAPFFLGHIEYSRVVQQGPPLIEEGVVVIIMNNF